MVLISEKDVRDVLQKFQDPESGRSVTTMNQVHGLEVCEDRISVRLGLTTWAAPVWSQTRAELENTLKSAFPQAKVNVETETHERKPEKLGEIGLTAKSVIAVGAGKGGVGKSSVSAYLALGLARAGCKVGLMDADVYGPSVPHLLGCNEKPYMIDNRIQPIEVSRLKIMSMGLLIPQGEAVIWRGPMLNTALTQFLRDTEWGDLDYLIIDMPPGTGDIAISLSQLIPLTGAVVVCTPQDVALLDAVKAVKMFEKVNIDVLGMVENMSFFICSNCQARHDIFSSGGAEKCAKELRIPFLGEIPLIPELRAKADDGLIAASFENEQARPYLETISANLVQGLVTSRRKEPPLPNLTILK